VDPALLARRLPGGLVALRGGRRRGLGRGDVLAPRPVVRERVLERLQLLAGPAVPEAAQQRAPALAAAVADRERVREPLADPALVGGARRAQVAHEPARAARDEGLGLLAAQHRAAADVTGDGRM
jgi:hypothetical protein